MFCAVGEVLVAVSGRLLAVVQRQAGGSEHIQKVSRHPDVDLAESTLEPFLELTEELEVFGKIRDVHEDANQLVPPGLLDHQANGLDGRTDRNPHQPLVVIGFAVDGPPGCAVGADFDAKSLHQ